MENIKKLKLTAIQAEGLGFESLNSHQSLREIGDFFCAQKFVSALQAGGLVGATIRDSKRVVAPLNSHGNLREIEDFFYA